MKKKCRIAHGEFNDKDKNERRRRKKNGKIYLKVEFVKRISHDCSVPVNC